MASITNSDIAGAEAQSAFRALLNDSQPLVSLDDVKAHLRLIASFNRLIAEFGTQGDLKASASIDAFLRRALYRFELWVTTVFGNPAFPGNPELPPLDVALILHAYMLNPHRFFEDATTRFPQLWSFSPYPLTKMAELVDPITFEYKASAEQRKDWELRTHVNFDPKEYLTKNPIASITCPSCEASVEVPWENEGLGFGEANFSFSCPVCNCAVTHDKLSLAKFLQCLHSSALSCEAFLPGTLVNVCGDVDLPRARAIAAEVMKALKRQDESLPSVKDVTMGEIATQLRSAQHTKLRPDRVDTLLLPYQTATPFSRDLARSAKLLNCELHDQLVRRGWCTQEYLSGPCSELEKAYSDYCLFLELATHPERGAIAPNADIDLVWHTHQLAGSQYKEDMDRLLGIYLDHISREEDMSRWVTARQNTTRRWAKIRVEHLADCTGATCCTSVTQDFIYDADES